MAELRGQNLHESAYNSHSANKLSIPTNAKGKFWNVEVFKLYPYKTFKLVDNEGIFIAAFILCYLPCITFLLAFYQKRKPARL
jgi:hypothetical protein